MTEEIYNELMKDYERQLYTSKELAYVSFKDLNHKQRLSDIYTAIFNRDKRDCRSILQRASSKS